jgi:hypothetical protein
MIRASNMIHAIACATMLAAGFAEKARAQDLFPAGVETKSTGMESAIAVRSAPATLYNPANLGLEPARKRAYFEAGAIRARMAYEHPQYDQVFVEVNSPLATAGVTGAFVDQRLRAGLAIFPAKSGGIVINGIPQPVAGETHSLSVENSDQTIKTAIGASWAIMPGINLGTGIIHTSEDRLLSARVVGSATPLLNQRMSNDFTRGIAGVRADSRVGSVAAALTTPVRKTYDGESSMAGSNAPSKPQTVAYEPAVVATGWSVATGPVRTEFSLNHRMWGDAAGVMREGLASSTSGADIHDVTETGLRLTWAATPKLTLSGSLANLPSPWGEGGIQQDTGPLMGPGFGMANGIDRQSIGLLAHSSGTRFGTFDVGLMNMWGNRTVSRGGANPGHYQLDVITLTAASTIVF